MTDDPLREAREAFLDLIADGVLTEDEDGEGAYYTLHGDDRSLRAVAVALGIHIPLGRTAADALERLIESNAEELYRSAVAAPQT